MQEKSVILDGVGIPSVDMVAQNLVNGGMKYIYKKYQIQVDILPNNISNNYIYELAYFFLDDIDVDTIHKKTYKYWLEIPISNARNTDYLPLYLQRVQKM